MDVPAEALQIVAALLSALRYLINDGVRQGVLIN
jgi:hypothetical protein